MKKFSFLLSIILLLLSCSKGLDYSLTTDEGEFEYNISLKKAFKNMSKEDIDLFNFVMYKISKFDSLKSLDEKYHNQTPRYIITQEINDKKGLLEQELSNLKEVQQKYDVVFSNLSHIRRDRIFFNYNKDILGIKPVISLTITNLSSYDISSIYWLVKIYINNNIEPIAVARFQDVYNSVNNPDGAMLMNKSYNRRFELGIIRSDNGSNNILQDIQNAQQVKLILEPVLETAKDINGKNILPENPYPRIDEIKNYLYKINKYSDIYTN